MSIRSRFSVEKYLVVGPENTLERPVPVIVAAAVDAGFTCVQIRSKTASAGELIRLCVERYFFYNGDEYVLLSDRCDLPEGEDVSHYVMKVQPLEGEGQEDMEEFVPVDEDLMDQLVQVAESVFDDED